MDLKGKEGELRFTLEITRATTGEKETVEMVGRIGDIINNDEVLDHGSNTLDRSA